MPDSSPAWWVLNIENTSPANLNIAPVKGVVTPQMTLIHSLNGAAADPPATVANDSYSDILWQNTMVRTHKGLGAVL
jgi:hypothetical protein